MWHRQRQASSWHSASILPCMSKGMPVELFFVCVLRIISYQQLDLSLYIHIVVGKLPVRFYIGYGAFFKEQTTHSFLNKKLNS